MKKVLIANRGEIAVRIARTLRELGLQSVAVYSTADREALHVACCDEAIALGPAPAHQSYLSIERLLQAAAQVGADALHPGYGFLSESPRLAEACAAAGLEFIGPSATAMRKMSSKLDARLAMQHAGVPVTPGGSAHSLEDARQTAQAIGYPLLLKPSAGGGGKGMRRVDSEQDLPTAYARARSEAQSAFGDDTLYLEKLIDAARHVEVQLLGDKHGRVVHLYERDCSLQRRHQKIIEETPCPRLSADQAEELGRLAASGAAAIGYASAGTMKFLLAPGGELYFMEMNTRLQVEHPITELTVGVDLVEWMVRVAQGEALPRDWPPPRRGHAIECRIYAEDPARGFLPSPGRVTRVHWPSGPGVRVDEGVRAGQRVPAEYDPLIAKVSVHAADRAGALRRARRALEDCVVQGIATNLDFLCAALRDAEFASSLHHTRTLDTRLGALLSDAELTFSPERDPASAAPDDDAHVLAAALAGLAWSDDTAAATGPAPAAPQAAWTQQDRAALQRRWPR